MDDFSQTPNLNLMDMMVTVFSTVIKENRLLQRLIGFLKSKGKYIVTMIIITIFIFGAMISTITVIIVHICT